MARSNTKRFPTVVFCDDVREEINNKKILIGVYASDILVQDFPATIGFSMYVEYIPEESGDEELEFRIRIGDKKPAKLKGLAHNLKAGEVSTIPFPNLQMVVEKPGELTIDAIVGKRRPVRLVTKAIRQMPPSD